MPASDDPLDTPATETPANGAMSAADVAQIVTDAQAPLLNQIGALTESQQQSAEQFQQLAQMVSSNNNPAPAAVDGEEDFLTELTTNPRLAVGKIVQESMGALAPFLGKIAESGSNAFIGIERQQIDEQFGSGAWDAHFDKRISSSMTAHGQNNPAALADSGLLHREVNELKGENLDALVKFREEHQTQQATTANSDLDSMVQEIAGEVMRRTNGTGGLRRIEATGEEVTEAVKGYLSEVAKATGKQVDSKKWLSDTNYGNTIEDYRKKQADIKAANGAAH